MKLIYAGNPKGGKQVAGLGFMLKYVWCNINDFDIEVGDSVNGKIDEHQFRLSVDNVEFINGDTVVTLIKPYNPNTSSKSWLNGLYKPHELDRLTITEIERSIV